MQMARHNAVSVNSQPSFLLIVCQAIQQNMLVFLSGKQIYPKDHRTGDEIDSFGISEFVLF